MLVRELNPKTGKEVYYDTQHDMIGYLGRQLLGDRNDVVIVNYYSQAIANQSSGVYTYAKYNVGKNTSMFYRQIDTSTIE